MIGKKIIEEIPVTQSEALEILKKLEKEKKKSESSDEELLYEQKSALEHLKRFKKIDAKKAKELVNELLGISDKINLSNAVKIADLMPDDEATIKAIFSKERASPSDEEIKKILEIVDKYRA